MSMGADSPHILSTEIYNHVCLYRLFALILGFSNTKKGIPCWLLVYKLCINIQKPV